WVGLVESAPGTSATQLTDRPCVCFLALCRRSQSDGRTADFDPQRTFADPGIHALHGICGVPSDRQPQGRASRTILNGVSVARRKRVKPPEVTTCRSRVSPACAPRPSPTSWLSDAGVQTIVEAA